MYYLLTVGLDMKAKLGIYRLLTTIIYYKYKKELIYFKRAYTFQIHIRVFVSPNHITHTHTRRAASY